MAVDLDKHGFPIFMSVDRVSLTRYAAARSFRQKFQDTLRSVGLWVLFVFDKCASLASGAQKESGTSAIYGLTDLFLRAGELSRQHSSQYD